MPDRRDVDQLLDDMDDVIADWHGSRDAMRWHPETEQPMSLNEAFRQLGEACNGLVQGLVEMFRSPDYQAFIEAARLALPAEQTQPCHCLCLRHPGRSCCLGEVPVSEVKTVYFGYTGVPMCAPCATVAPKRSSRKTAVVMGKRVSDDGR